MSMFKKISIICLCLCVCYANNLYAQDVWRKLIKFTKTYTLNSYYDDSIVLLTPRKWGLKTAFFTQWISANAILKTQDSSCVAINGFYFGRGIDGNPLQPAGPVTFYKGLRNKPEILPSTTNPADDVNLWINIFYSSTNNTISLNKPISISYGASFFAGPMIIDEGEINTNLNNKISHRSTQHYRTFIIKNTKNKAIFWISKTKISLYELWQKLANIYGKENISVVNLDGGSSTSIGMSEYNFNATKTLPSWFSTCNYTD